MTGEAQRRCPFCSELILANAIKCKHCGTMLTTTRPGSTGADTPAGDNGWGAYAPIAIGTDIREYRVDALLGEGGMGAVYRGTHLHTGQKAAIKVVSGDLLRNENIRKRFLQEARLMAGLRHPNIVTLYTFFEEAGRFFLVMEYIEGCTLEDLLEERPLSPDEAVRIIVPVLEALHYAHSRAQPVIHRDIKPANIMLDNDGRPVVMDFGIAKAVGGEKLTRTAGVVGTFEFMSPEQVQGHEVTPATDQYAVGITLYKMLTGVVPFPQRADTGLDCMNAHIQQPPPPLAEFREGIPPWLETVVVRSLAKDPAARFPSNVDMVAALQAGIAGGAPPTPTPPQRPTPQSTLPPTPPRPIPSPQPIPTPDGGGSRKTGLYIMGGVGGLIVLAAILVVAGVFKPAEKEASEKILTVERERTRGEKGKPVPAQEPGPNDFEPAPEPVPAIVAAAPACVPSCAGKQCGANGCGGDCGTCPGGRACTVEGACTCSGVVCAGNCCPSGQICRSGSCCTPSCSGRDCGDDGCGGTCGSCPGRARCEEHICVKPAPVERQYPNDRIRATASSTDPTTKNSKGDITYYASNVLDGNPETTWAEGVKGYGVGESITLRFDEPIRASKIRVWNGYQKIKNDKFGDRYWGNPRPHGIRIVTDQGSRNATLRDSKTPQEIALDGGETRSVRIEIRSVYEGLKDWYDTAVCEIEILHMVNE